MAATTSSNARSPASTATPGCSCRGSPPTNPNSQWPAGNLILSAESHDNADSDGEDADGFAAKLTVGAGNVFRYAVAHHNIDDGWDLYTKTDTGPIGVVTVEDSLAYSNGTLSNAARPATVTASTGSRSTATPAP